MFKRFGFGAAASALVMASSAAYAQQVASSVRGVVTGEGGSAITGATVTITHVPSGTVSSSVTTVGGSFFVGGLRVGGPYTVAIDAPGFEGAVLENLFLNAGSPEPITATLRTEATETIVVYGVRPSQISLNNGVGSAFTGTDIQNQPSITRDPIRTLLRDPITQSNGTGNLSVAGVNPRFNNLSIDGSLQKDDLGLGSSTFPTARSPINIDTIESIALLASDYSVTSSNFTGGLVNVVTKSGTNEFDGAAFYFYRDEDFQGRRAFNRDLGAPAPFEEREYGVSLGGPIIKDKLFFFASYDEFKSARGLDFRQADINNGVTQGFYDALNTLVRNTYGLDMGGRPGVAATPESSKRQLIKLDWNINADHRAQFSYQKTEELGVSVSSTSFRSAWYDIPVVTDAYNVAVFSDWTPNLSTTLRANYKEFERGQICGAGANTAELAFDLSAGGDVTGSPLAGLITRTGDLLFIGGCDRFRHANEYNDKKLQLFASADYALGDHLITLGAEYQDFSLYNLFVESASAQYFFETAAQIAARTPQTAAFRAPTSGNPRDGAADWGYRTLSLFVQDTWQILPNLELTGGLRYERVSTDDRTPRDAGVAADFGRDPSVSIDGLDIILPRFSFRWEPSDKTTVSGGFGLFAGGSPNVWISNAYQPAVVTVATGGTGQPAAPTNVDPRTVSPSLVALARAGTPRIIDSISPNFEVPSDWKASLRVDHEFDIRLPGGLNLGDDYIASAQVLYTDSKDGFLWYQRPQTDLARTRPLGVAPDGRPIYADLNALNIQNLTELRNGDGGSSLVFSLGLAKSWDSGFDASVGYAYQDIEAITEGTSSRGISSWRGIIAEDRNNPVARTSPFQIEHAFRVSLGYERDFLGDLTSRFDIFGDISSGAPFTYTFDVGNDTHLFGRAFGTETPFDNNPLYVPNGPTDPRVVYNSSFNQAAFFDYVAARGIAPGIQEVNGRFSNWTQKWDFQYSQELPGIWGADRFVGDNRFKFVFAVENFLNLLNDEWGTQYNAPGNGQVPLVIADLISRAALGPNPTQAQINAAPALNRDAYRTTCTTADACVYRFNTFQATNAARTAIESNTRSVFTIRVGLRYEF